ncbi:MAG: glucose 1-dehydrogenase [Acidimicrobiaceae bacterium]|nr:glucose 1-dehydrogenase [Acidimicrobiaceae bacterium]
MGEGRFREKVVVVTGGGAGIGRTYAHRFAAEGARAVIADVDAEAAKRVVGELEAAGCEGLAFAMDVTDDTAVQEMAAAAQATFGRLDILINNAGTHLDHAQLPYTMDALPQWRAVMDVNVIGALACTVACRPAMAAHGGGAVINQSSMAAYSGAGAYGVSKLALNSLTVSLAAELASDGIRVNGIAPGLVDSEAAVAWMHDPARAGIEERIVGGQLVKRLGRMDDLANMVLFLCSADASFITGQTILVDGGFTKKPF